MKYLSGIKILPSSRSINGRRMASGTWQEASIFRKMTVEDNIRSVLGSRISRPRNKEKLESLIDEFGLEKVRKSGDRLSGGGADGQDCDAAIDPKFIMLMSRSQGSTVLCRISIHRGTTGRNIGILITDHNVDETLSIRMGVSPL